MCPVERYSKKNFGRPLLDMKSPQGKLFKNITSSHIKMVQTNIWPAEKNSLMSIYSVKKINGQSPHEFDDLRTSSEKR